MSLDVNDLFPRAAVSCTGSKQWYVCTAGNFRGCCSSDPCTSGVCPDNNGDDALSTSVPEATSVAGLTAITARIGIPLLSSSRTSLSTTSSTDSSISLSSQRPLTVSLSTSSTSFDTTTTSETQTASDTPTTTATATTSTTLEATHVTALSSVLGGSHASTASPSSESSNSGAAPNRGALIGGVVGGVAALIICAILLFCCYRRRRIQGKHEKLSSIISWYPHGAARSRYGRHRSSDAKAISDSDGNTATDSLTTSIPANSSTAPSTTFPLDRRPSNTPPSITMGSHNHSNSSSSTNLVSHPLRLKSSSTTSIPPMPLPHRQGFSPTPELPDTSFYRLCHELASHSQSGLINGPIDQRCRNRTGNGNGSPRGMAMRAWESTSSIPLTYTSTSEGTSQSQSQTQSQSGSRSVGGSLIRQPAGQIITADGIVLGANLDRYSSGMEIGRSTGRGRDVGGSCHEHVMSFMHYGSGGGGGNGGGRAERGIQMLDTVHGDERVHSPSSEELRCQDATAVLDGLKVLEDDDGDVPPAYDGRDGFTDADIKSLAGMMEMGVRT